MGYLIVAMLYMQHGATCKLLHSTLTMMCVPCGLQLRQLDAWYRSEVERWAAEREELSKRCGQLEARGAQFAHELRRRDAEYERLQGRLRTLLR